MIIVLGLALMVMSISCMMLYIKSQKQYQEFKHQILLSHTEIEKLKKTESPLRQELALLQNKLNQVMEDSLTKLLGWQLFEDRLAQSIHESARYQLTMAVLIIDIDDFKIINNALSHEIGDEVLRIVAKRIQTCIRQVDSASRFAKDTFYVLLTQLSKPETAAIVAQRILQTFKEPILVNEHELYATACIGIALYPTDGLEATTVLRNADYALHIAKRKGKQAYQFYQEKIHANSQRELALSTGLRRETVTEEFIIYYQPIMNIKNEKVIGMDTLLHWQHPSLGLVSPFELLSYADKQNKLNIISEWLLRQACKQFLAWQKMESPPTLLAIPLYFKQLENSQFIYQISQILQDLQFNPECLLFEIKEHAGPLALDSLEKGFNMLHYLHIQLAIDDFGVVSFSLRDLKNMTVNFLKLNPLLIDDLENNPKTMELIESMLFLANKMSIQLIIKGVETRAQFNLLKKLDCTLMQGQLLAAPLSAKEIADSRLFEKVQNLS